MFEFTPRLDIEFSQLLCWVYQFVKDWVQIWVIRVFFPKVYSQQNKDLYKTIFKLYLSQLMNCLFFVASKHPQVASPPLLALAFLGDSNVPPPRLCLDQSIHKTKRWSWKMGGSDNRTKFRTNRIILKSKHWSFAKILLCWGSQTAVSRAPAEVLLIDPKMFFQFFLCFGIFQCHVATAKSWGHRVPTGTKSAWPAQKCPTLQFRICIFSGNQSRRWFQPVKNPPVWPTSGAEHIM